MPDCGFQAGVPRSKRGGAWLFYARVVDLAGLQRIYQMHDRPTCNLLKPGTWARALGEVLKNEVGAYHLVEWLSG